MKKITALAVLGLTAAASADVVVNLAGTLGAGESLSASVVVTGTLTGIDVSFEYGEPVSDGSWASDVQMTVADADADFVVGGFDNIGSADVAWVFDGPGSDAGGTYADSFSNGSFPVLNSIGDGKIDILWVNDWAFDGNPNTYDVTITLYGVTAVPAPGALALLGLAGLAGRRRRA